MFFCFIVWLNAIYRKTKYSNTDIQTILHSVSHKQLKIKFVTVNTLYHFISVLLFTIDYPSALDPKDILGK